MRHSGPGNIGDSVEVRSGVSAGIGLGAGTEAAATQKREDVPVHPTVVIVDDSDDFRLCLRALLEFEDFEVVAEAIDGSSAVPLILAFSPSLVLLDVRLPDISGFGVADRLASAGYQGSVVLVSSRRVTRSAIKVAPVAGFVSKEEISGETLRRFVDTAA